MHPSRTAPVDVDTLTRVQQLLTRVPTDQAVPSAGMSGTLLVDSFLQAPV